VSALPDLRIGQLPSRLFPAEGFRAGAPGGAGYGSFVI